MSRVIVLFLASVVSTFTNAAQLRIDFGGTFACVGVCDGTEYAGLDGRSFTGTVRFPDSGVDLVAADPYVGHYVFAAGEASLDLTTGVAAFEVLSGAPVAIWVLDNFSLSGEHNIGPNTRDIVWIDFVRGEHQFELALAGQIGIATELTSDAIPGAATLSDALMLRQYGIFPADLSGDVLASASGLQPFNVSAVPIPPAILLGGSAMALLLAGSGRRTTCRRTSASGAR
jgi:hypothetical protein